MSVWRPIHKELSEEAIKIGGTIHLAMVTDDDPQQFTTACTHGLGDWITGKGSQVTCDDCKEFVHA